MARLILLLAEGFGTGRSPVAPGTFGTLLGFGWIFLLALPRSLPFYFAGTILGILAALWIGAKAEKILGQKDPGSIVIDEIACLPIVFVPVLLQQPGKSAVEHFSQHPLELFLIFALFRLFDIWKPMGINRSQNLPGGLVWDDALAALAAALVLWGILALRG